MILQWLFGCSSLTPEARFWTWFNEHEDMLFHFENDQERTFKQLSTALSKVHPDLTFEFGPAVSGKREFVISAGGIRAAFPAVESLYQAAPALERWVFIKFRPRREPMKLEFANIKIAPEDVAIAISPDGAKAGLTIYMRNFTKTPDSSYEQVGYLFLDQAIGEFDMETKVGFIEFAPFDSPSQSIKHGLTEFPSAFDTFGSPNS